MQLLSFIFHPFLQQERDRKMWIDEQVILLTNKIKKNMEDWKERLIKEQKELKEKLAKLTDFINSEKFYKLSQNNRQLLKNQKIAMELYLNVLNMRLFEDVDEITVLDYGMMQVIGSFFGGNVFNSQKSNAEMELEKILKNNKQ